jgi:hypothetical protein
LLLSPVAVKQFSKTTISKELIEEGFATAYERCISLPRLISRRTKNPKFNN